MIGLRQKLLFGFAGLMAIMVLIALESILLLLDLNKSSDTLLREDFRSVLASQEMRESLEMMDSGIQYSLLGDIDAGHKITARNAVRFQKALVLELQNTNLPGEEESAERLTRIFQEYESAFPEVFDDTRSEEDRTAVYFNRLVPLSEQGRSIIDEILRLSQDNMDEAGARLHESAVVTITRIAILLSAGTLISVLFIILMRRWILLPIQHITESVEQVHRGNLNVPVPVTTGDELGRLAHAFNGMAARLRALRSEDQAQLLRTQRTTQLAVDSLRDAVAVLSPDGRIDMVNQTAGSLFHLVPGKSIYDYHGAWLGWLCERVLHGNSAQAAGYEESIRILDAGRERFFLPNAVPILDEEKKLVGITVVLTDVTRLRKLDELKTGLLSTVSHELRTPLTAMQMAIHLLAEGKAGALQERQMQLALATRDECDRLCRIVENLLDLSSVESDGIRMDLRRITVNEIVAGSVEPMRQAMERHGLSFQLRIEDGDTAIWADPVRMGLVFQNLLSNAIKYTSSGGKVCVATCREQQAMRFSVSDNGVGIPGAFVDKIFDKFFRVPNDSAAGGMGLGLGIARDIVEAHGGHIECRSKENEGSTFTFTILRADLESTDMMAREV